MWQDPIYPKVYRALGTHGSPPDRESNVVLWNIPRPIRHISKDTVSRRIIRRVRHNMAHFYLTLPCNSSLRYFPNNAITRYTTRLESVISLSGDWEVGLVEM